MRKKELFSHVLQYLGSIMDDTETELHYRNPFELLVAVVLSAQCTDKRINQVTPALFEAYPTPQAMAQATPDDIFHYIRSVSYPNNKARHLAGMARKLVDDFGGEVPTTLEELTTLPGVGRKTANVVLSNAFNIPAIAVDTHVFRVSNRLGLAEANNVLDTEKQLQRAIPREDWSAAHHWLIWHGRRVCTARNPHCDACPLSALCRDYQTRQAESAARSAHESDTLAL